MSQDYVITLDHDVPIPDGTQRGTYVQAKERLISMQKGDSFFRENESRADVSGLVRYAKRIGVHLMARETDEDELFGVPGVRLWRVEQEDLPGRRPATSAAATAETYWRLGSHVACRVLATTADSPPDLSEGWTQIGQAEFLERRDECPDHVRYFLDGNGGLTVLPLNTTLSDLGDDVAEISAAEYAVRKEKAGGATRTTSPKAPVKARPKKAAAKKSTKAKEAAAEPTYWKHPCGAFSVEYLPGHSPEPEKGFTEISRAEHLELADRTEFLEPGGPKLGETTYWELPSGDCVKMPAHRMHEALLTPGAKQITQEDFEEWDENTL